MSELTKVRLDKWLWSVRIFKSRTMATDACKAGKVKSKGTALKPSYLLTPGEVLEVRKNGFNFVFKVNHLLEKRVSAVQAAPCFDDMTSQEELNKYRNWFDIKATAEIRKKGDGRPTKKERREMDEFKDMFFYDEFDEAF
ncbi:MAG: RNA-binding S4 domain-containing protein [Saprospiraceae bacterium]|nr:MAG: RNA-binding S4 domain-containing protein [Bacteroidetes bacterium OLB9]MCO6463490.1 RNA-binding S4 domain-containing protein [Saprospiraceae bacterium]